MKNTTLDYAILGLLTANPMTTYAIRKAFEETAIGNYSSSPGSIYPAVSRLRKLKLVVNTKEKSNTKIEISEKGKATIKEWLTCPIQTAEIAKDSSLLILKFAFMDNLVTKKQKINFLNSLVEKTSAYLQSLENYHRDHAEMMPLHGRLAFEFGIANFKTQLSWAKSSVLTIQQ